MPTEEETKQLVANSSPRGQPIPPGEMELAKSIAGDTKRSEFYAVDQDRDEHGRFEDEGKGKEYPKAGVITAEGVAASIKEVKEARERGDFDPPDPVLSKAISVWTTPPSLTNPNSTANLDSESIRAIRGAAQQIKSGKDVKGEHADMARALLSHSEVIDRPIMRGTSSGYFAKPDATPEEVLSKFPIGEDIDLTLYSFTQNLTPRNIGDGTVPQQFARWAQGRKGGEKMYITLEKGGQGVRVENYSEGEETHIEDEVITTGHATIKLARFNEKDKQFEITLGNK